MKIFLLNLFSLEEDVLFFNNISLSENTFKSSAIEVKNEINNGIIPELSKKNQDFFNNYLEPKIVFPNESSAKKKNYDKSKKDIYNCISQKKYLYFQKLKENLYFLDSNKKIN